MVNVCQNRSRLPTKKVVGPPLAVSLPGLNEMVCIVTVTSPGQTISRPLVITCRLPEMLIGTIGTFASSASTNDPRLKRAMVPSRLRVPSGKTIRE